MKKLQGRPEKDDTTYMTNDAAQQQNNVLKNLLKDVSDQKERERLTKAWNMLSTTLAEQCATPTPSKELEMIFKKDSKKQNLNKEMSDNELEGIAAAGGWTVGTNGDDLMIGGDGNDMISGKDGSDEIHGGEGDDTLDGGFQDGADDTLYGEAGDDTAIWGPSSDGNDFFDGGVGNDTLAIDLMFSGQSSLQAAFESGYLTLTIDGNPDFVPTFNSDGNIILPSGVSGIITGPTGETMTFTGVETICVL